MTRSRAFLFLGKNNTNENNRRIKSQVDQIILISGDSDFVPAAKQARREGIDFILDPMGAPIKEDLFEHIDGIRTPKFNTANKEL